MAMFSKLTTFRNVAILYLIDIMKKHSGESVPALTIGTFIVHMTGWENDVLAELINFMESFDQSDGSLEDSVFLLKYVPQRKFASQEEIVSWTLGMCDIQKSVDEAAHWGFVTHHKRPKPAVLWNAFLLGGVHVLTRRNDKKEVAKDHVFFLFSLLGYDRTQALRIIEIAS